MDRHRSQMGRHRVHGDRVSRSAKRRTFACLASEIRCLAKDFALIAIQMATVGERFLYVTLDVTLSVRVFPRSAEKSGEATQGFRESHINSRAVDVSGRILVTGLRWA
jgi:hypothetical protein